MLWMFILHVSEAGCLIFRGSRRQPAAMDSRTNFLYTGRVVSQGSGVGPDLSRSAVEDGRTAPETVGGESRLVDCRGKG